MTRAGLSAALASAGSWAELSRRTSVPASTLKSRGARFNLYAHSAAEMDDAAANPSCVATFATTIAHAIVATVIELEKGHPIEEAWHVHERRLQRDIVAATQRLLDELVCLREALGK